MPTFTLYLGSSNLDPLCRTTSRGTSSHSSRLFVGVPTMTNVLVVDDHHRDNLAEFGQAVDKVISTQNDSRVAFDCEGVRISRVGTVEIVSICFEEPASEKQTVFLVDLNNEKQTRNLHERVAILKRLLESPETVKVIHDCRMDSDVLYHKHGIRLRNVHDTSCFHAI